MGTINIIEVSERYSRIVDKLSGVQREYISRVEGGHLRWGVSESPRIASEKIVQVLGSQQTHEFLCATEGDLRIPIRVRQPTAFIAYDNHNGNGVIIYSDPCGMEVVVGPTNSIKRAIELSEVPESR